MRQQLQDRADDWRWFATPRRLAVWVPGVAARATRPPRAGQAHAGERRPRRRGPADAGAAEEACRARRRCGGGARAAAPCRRQERKPLPRQPRPGRRPSPTDCRRRCTTRSRKLPIPKVMQYQLDDGWTERRVRPSGAWPGRAARRRGRAGARARPRRRPHDARPSLRGAPADDRAARRRQLRRSSCATTARCIASFDERRAEIDAQLGAAAAGEGLRPIDDEALLDEVTALVERPNVLLCRFDAEFLAVPPECLVLTMKANQKYFPLLDGERSPDEPFPRRQQHPAGRSVAHRRRQRARRPAAPRRRQVLLRPGPQAHARVARSSARQGRLPRQARQPGRSRRVACARSRAGSPSGSAPTSRAPTARRSLAKADLLTDMVGEFPELQGIMGGYYAAHDGESPEVVAGDPRPVREPARRRRRRRDRTRSATRCSIADRAETLVGIWGIGLKPTGDKDPYALRRHALTLIDALQRIAQRGAARTRSPCASCSSSVVATFVDAARGRCRRRGRGPSSTSATSSSSPRSTTRARSTR